VCLGFSADFVWFWCLRTMGSARSPRTISPWTTSWQWRPTRWACLQTVSLTFNAIPVFIFFFWRTSSDSTICSCALLMPGSTKLCSCPLLIGCLVIIQSRTPSDNWLAHLGMLCVRDDILLLVTC
jgi:hypothetical protein